MAKKKYLISGYGLRLLMFLFLLSFILILISIDDLSKEIFSYPDIILFSLGILLLILIGFITLKLDKVTKAILLIVFLVSSLVLYRGHDYFTLKITFLVVVFIIGLFYVKKNFSKIQVRGEKLSKSKSTSNWFYNLFGLKELK